MIDFRGILGGRAIAAGVPTPPQQIAATDSPIDRLVYDLYDLTEKKINIVEGVRRDEPLRTASR